MAGVFSARSLRETPLFQEQLRLIQPDAQRLDAQLRGLTWGLANDPDYWPSIGNSKLHRALTDPWPGAPRLRIWYMFDDEYVELLAIEVLEEDEEDEEENGD